VDDVPDLRAFGKRIVHCVLALGLGFATAWALAMLLPQGDGREASPARTRAVNLAAPGVPVPGVT
jgi:hypothetical protein